MTVIIPYREWGQGTPLLFLHGGWGYAMYPFDIQIAALRDRYRILIPDRAGYGKAARVTSFPRGFHENAAREMLEFLDSLNIERCVLWGHSDGAVTAIRMGLSQPERFSAIVGEAIHYDRSKPSSRAFFETAATNPRGFGSGVAKAMASEHGEDYWEFLMRVHGKAWLDILDNCSDPEQDLYSGRIGELPVPTLLIHGSRDPRTEAGELDRLQEALPALRVHLISGATHSPHSEPEYASEATRVVEAFLKECLTRLQLPSDEARLSQ